MLVGLSQQFENYHLLKYAITLWTYDTYKYDDKSRFQPNVQIPSCGPRHFNYGGGRYGEQEVIYELSYV